MATDPLDYAVDLASVRTRLEGLGYFLSVTDILEASEALDATVPAHPPAAFVAVSSESADPNNTVGGFAQRVRVELSVLFVEATSRIDQKGGDQVEQTRKAIIRQLFAWAPPGAMEPLQYGRYRVVRIGDGLAWAEVTFRTSYRLFL